MNGQELLQNLITAISLGSLYALFALGIAVIFGVMRLINFAHGELIMISGYTLIWLTHTPQYVSILVACAVGCVAALTMNQIGFRPLRGASPATLLVMSFGISYLLQNLAAMIVGPMPRTTPLFTSLTAPVSFGSITISRLSLVTLGVTVVLLVALGGFLGRTRLGVQMRAAAEDFPMSRLLGVRANTVIAVSFGISGVLAAVAAILLVAQTGAVSIEMGLDPVVVAFVATALGGLGSLGGAVLGGYSVGFIAVALQAYLPLALRPYRDAFVYAVIIAVFLVRPGGLIISRSVATRV